MTKNVYSYYKNFFFSKSFFYDGALPPPPPPPCTHYTLLHNLRVKISETLHLHGVHFEQHLKKNLDSYPYTFI